ncbi:MAG: glutaredoxin [Saprospiraceae bacterium]|jgi:glutaredoxin
MKTGNGFDQCYNNQAAVNDEMLIVGALVNAHCNDKKELVPTLDKIDKILGKIDTAMADNGYFSEANIKQVEERNIAPYLAAGGENIISG